MHSPTDKLDNHLCPKCNWSFIDRIPRTLDCKHSFYFCESCLKKRENVQCGICRRVTIIKQILSPRAISKKSYNISTSFTDDGKKNDTDIDTLISQFATLPTQLLSKHEIYNKNNNNQFETVHKLFTSPLKHYKHYNKHNRYNASSEPVKNSNIKQNLQFEYDDIINIQKEIVSLKNELKSGSNQNDDDNIENEMHFMKKQIVELLINKEKLIKQCNDTNQQMHKLKEDNIKLTTQNIQQKQDFDDLQNKYQELKQSTISKDVLNKLQPIKLQCRCLSDDIDSYKQTIHNSIFKSFLVYMDDGMNELLSKCKQILKEYNKEVSLRRKYFNDIQELKGSIRVYCRIRPILTNELNNNCAEKVRAVDDFKVNIEKTKENDRSKDYQKTFEFDKVFSKRSTQEEVFNDTKDLITSVLDGYNVCIFAYGPTGSGKTYTMEGINYRAVSQLFKEINQRKLNYKYKMKLNLLEIYNEKVKDLLVTSNNNENKKDLKLRALPTYLKIRGGDKNGVHIGNLSELNCESMDDVFKALDIGYSNRSSGVTDLNEHSSRSHCILTINVEGMHFKSRTKYMAKLNLIDLSGSERVKMSNVTGVRLKEAQCINKSLSCLGNVLESIKLKKSYIPYRDSKLTFLLKDSIGNGAKTLMFVNTSPCSKDVNQTLISLLFANRVRNVCLGKSVKNQYKMTEKKKHRSSISSTS